LGFIGDYKKGIEALIVPIVNELQCKEFPKIRFSLKKYSRKSGGIYNGTSTIGCPSFTLFVLMILS